MDIQEYVSKALGQIDAGIHEANKHTQDRNFLLKKSETVKFDLAVVNKVSPDGKIQAMVFEIGGGLNGNISKDQISRINFQVEHCSKRR